MEGPTVTLAVAAGTIDATISAANVSITTTTVTTIMSIVIAVAVLIVPVAAIPVANATTIITRIISVLTVTLAVVRTALVVGILATNATDQTVVRLSTETELVQALEIMLQMVVDLMNQLFHLEPNTILLY